MLYASQGAENYEFPCTYNICRWRDRVGNCPVACEPTRANVSSPVPAAERNHDLWLSFRLLVPHYYLTDKITADLLQSVTQPVHLPFWVEWPQWNCSSYSSPFHGFWEILRVTLHQVSRIHLNRGNNTTWSFCWRSMHHFVGLIHKAGC